MLLFRAIHSMQLRNQAMFLLLCNMDRAERERATRRRIQRRRQRRLRYLQSETAQLAMVESLLQAVLRGCISERIPRQRPQGQVFWERSVLNFSDFEWKEHFRVSRETFEFLAVELRPVLEKNNTNFKHSIEYKRRLAIVLWWLATPGEYRTIGNLVYKSTTMFPIQNAIAAMFTFLRP